MISFSVSSQPQDHNQVSRSVAEFLPSEPPGKPYLEQTFQEFTFLWDSSDHCRILPRAQCFQGWKVGCIRSLQPGGCDFKSG